MDLLSSSSIRPFKKRQETKNMGNLWKGDQPAGGESLSLSSSVCQIKVGGVTEWYHFFPAPTLSDRICISRLAGAGDQEVKAKQRNNAKAETTIIPGRMCCCAGAGRDKQSGDSVYTARRFRHWTTTTSSTTHATVTSPCDEHAGAPNKNNRIERRKWWEWRGRVHPHQQRRIIKNKERQQVYSRPNQCCTRYANFRCQWKIRSGSDSRGLEGICTKWASACLHLFFSCCGCLLVYFGAVLQLFILWHITYKI